MDIYPQSVMGGSTDVVTARLRSGTVSSPRPNVWPLVSPVGGSPVLEQPTTNYPAQIGLGAPAEPGRFGDLTINSDWGWLYDAPLDMLSALVQNQQSAGDYYFLRSGEPVNAETWTPQDIFIPNQQAAAEARLIGGPGIDSNWGVRKVSVDLAADPGLEFDAVGNVGKLRAKPNISQALTRGAFGIGLNLAEDPGLEFEVVGDTGSLRVKADALRGLTNTAAGLGLDPAGGAKYDVFYVDAAGGITRGPLKLRA